MSNLVQVSIWMWIGGFGTGVAVVLNWRRYLNTKADTKLRERNLELEEEVWRLRAQVAKHIGN